MFRPYPLLLLCLFTACDNAVDAPRLEVAITPDASGIETVVTDLGWTVTLTDARMAIADLAFSVAGETHTASACEHILRWLAPSARAHPGHSQGGGITGELPGRFVVQWSPTPSQDLGTAVLLAGRYTSANFTFIRAGVGDGLATNDPLMGHTALFVGRATREAASIDFTAVVDAPEGRALIGAPFSSVISAATTGSVGLRLLTRDPIEGDTLFDGIDFGTLPLTNDGRVVLAAPADTTSTGPLVDAYNRLRRTFMTHDHIDFQATWTP